MYRKVDFIKQLVHLSSICDAIWPILQHNSKTAYFNRDNNVIKFTEKYDNSQSTATSNKSVYITATVGWLVGRSVSWLVSWSADHLLLRDFGHNGIFDCVCLLL
jgi:hypothetical protein